MVLFVSFIEEGEADQDHEANVAFQTILRSQWSQPTQERF